MSADLSIDRQISPNTSAYQGETTEGYFTDIFPKVQCLSLDNLENIKHHQKERQ